MEDGECGAIGGQVQPVLTRADPRWSPFLQSVERVEDGSDHVIEHLKQPDLVHGTQTLPAGPTCEVTRLPNLWQL